MSVDEKELLKVGADAALAPVKDTINRLFGPFVDQVGGVMSDPIRVWRYERSLKLFEKVKNIAAQAGVRLSAVPLKTLLPILEHASVEDDDNLHDRWANLLTNAAVDAARVRVSFPEALKRLSPREARLLDHLHTSAVQLADRQHSSPVTAQEEILKHFSFDNIFKAYREIILMPADQDHWMAPQWNIAIRDCLGSLYVLIALGLVVAINPYGDAPNQHSYRITSLGNDFVTACSTPTESSK